MGIYASWGGVDVQDDLAAVDDAIARGMADPERLVVGGWSYGGMSTNYLIATTTRFKAAFSPGVCCMAKHPTIHRVSCERGGPDADWPDADA